MAVSIRSLLVLPLLWVLVFQSNLLAQDAVDAVTIDASSNKIAYLPLRNGGVDASDLFETLADDLHWVAGSVAGFSRLFGVEASGDYLPADQVDALVNRFPTIFSYQQIPDPDRAGHQVPGLAVNTAELAERMADKKSELRQWLAEVQGERLSELSKVDGTWEEPPVAPPTRILIVAAGLHSSADSAKAVALALHKQTNLPACVFAYPNDAPISESAQWLRMELSELHREYPTSRLTMVTHSMGGLVARGAMEQPEVIGSTTSGSFAASVGLDQLIQVCPPNHGSALAQYGPLLESFDQLYNLTNRRDGKRPRVLLKMITDGFNEASADLDPKSDLLRDLNRCPRDANVRYSILAGNAGPLKPGMTSLLGNVWDRIATAVDKPQELDVRVRDVIDCGELQNGRGDGVVTIESARLDGVADFQVLEMHHLAFAQLDSEPGQELIRQIASRIGVSL